MDSRSRREGTQSHQRRTLARWPPRSLHPWMGDRNSQALHSHLLQPPASCLPSDTPSGLQRLRELELENLRGTGEGKRKTFERIYDYDTYNDLGDPDKSSELERPVLGGKDHPYPRRCKTGRPHCKEDPLSEQRSSSVYVPRDEAFSEVKQVTFSAKALKSVMHALLPQLEISLLDPHLGFPHFTAIDSLFCEGLTLPKPTNAGFFQSILPRLVNAVTDIQENLLLFGTPKFIERDKFAWFRDDEFSRQTLADFNPYSIQLVTDWPMKSKLDPKIYGPPESLITTELVEREALKSKSLFVLDYHDLLLPYVNKVREVEGTTLYGSRALFFLTKDGTLRPVAIELTRPPTSDKPQWKQVFTPTWDATGCWLWRLAKAHVCAHDVGYHQLVIHWLRTHCCTEPYIIAANRKLSAMHPIYRLLHPHFKYTMEIYALARESLINAGGIIESAFSPTKYSTELGSAAYNQLWQFDMEALPADLIKRGMAVEDPTAEHGLKTPENLIHILTTIIWVTAGHHVAVSFGQYMFAGYFPNRPTIARTNMPTENPSDEEFKNFLKKPEVELLKCFPSQIQATKVMVVLDVLSNHSPDEEYLGENMEPSWEENPVIKALFEQFSGRLKELEGIIDERNTNLKLKNRVGAGVVPYELLKPFSKPGVTGRGVPNSISI